MEEVRKYSSAFVELKEIIKYMNEDIRNKLPESLINKIYNVDDKNYAFKYNENLPLYEQDLLSETKTLLSILYSDYLCSKEEREKWKQYDKFEQAKIEEQKQLIYNPDNLFKKPEKEVEPKKEIGQEVAIVEYHESIFKKIWNKLLSIFK